jgi:hypothetical protein
MNIAEVVDGIMRKVLFKAEELEGGVPADAVLVEAITRKFGFHPGRLEAAREEIAACIAELPDPFRKSKGGGWSFLQMCCDKNEKQWGEHTNCEALLALAIGTKQGDFLMPKDMWWMFPQSMPYVWLGE